jgi:hypothetical protein
VDSSPNEINFSSNDHADDGHVQAEHLAQVEGNGFTLDTQHEQESWEQRERSQQ